MGACDCCTCAHKCDLAQLSHFVSFIQPEMPVLAENSLSTPDLRYEYWALFYRHCTQQRDTALGECFLELKGLFHKLHSPGATWAQALSYTYSAKTKNSSASQHTYNLKRPLSIQATIAVRKYKKKQWVSCNCQWETLACKDFNWSVTVFHPTIKPSLAETLIATTVYKTITHQQPALGTPSNFGCLGFLVHPCGLTLDSTWKWKLLSFPSGLLPLLYFT